VFFPLKLPFCATVLRVLEKRNSIKDKAFFDPQSDRDSQFESAKDSSQINPWSIWQRYRSDPRGESLDFEHECTSASLNLLPTELTKIALVSPTMAILKDILERRLDLSDLPWRTFEELVASLLERDGFEVELQRGTKDGGVDILAKKDLGAAGKILSVWQAKRFKGRPVQINYVRELADTREQFRASKGVLVTSTFLTKGAIERIQRDCFILGKVDKTDLLDWIRRSLQD
jgi:restriction endonuclease Mrr